MQLEKVVASILPSKEGTSSLTFGVMSEYHEQSYGRLQVPHI